jgi:hypothetical protein
MCRAPARISAQVSSTVGLDVYPVCITCTPRSAAALRSMDALRGPVDAINFRLGNCSMRSRRSGVRSRITHTTSYGLEAARHRQLDRSR